MSYLVVSFDIRNVYDSAMKRGNCRGDSFGFLRALRR